MSYTMIFETRIVKLDDGRIIHFSLSGCNNDNEGRIRNEFTGKIYTADEWEAEISRWESINDEGFNLKISGRTRSYAEYGKHLRLMTKRAKTFDEMKKERAFWGIVLDGVTYYPADNSKPIEYPFGNECEKICDDVFYGRKKGRIARRTRMIDNVDDVVDSLTKKQPAEFYIGRKYKHIA